MGARAEEFCLESSWAIDASIRELLAVVRDPLSLASWWSAVFLRVELIEPGGSDLVGLAVRFHSKGFLPHTFQCTARISRADPRGALIIETWGDFEGTGTIETRRTASGLSIGIVWRVRVRQPYIRPFLRLLRPVFAANHRWAMRRGREGLEAEIRRRRQGVAVRPGTAWQTPTFPHNLSLMRRAFRWHRDAVRWSC
jgi:hypothetical protein